MYWKKEIYCEHFLFQLFLLGCNEYLHPRHVIVFGLDKCNSIHTALTVTRQWRRDKVNAGHKNQTKIVATNFQLNTLSKTNLFSLQARSIKCFNSTLQWYVTFDTHMPTCSPLLSPTPAPYFPFCPFPFSAYMHAINVIPLFQCILLLEFLFNYLNVSMPNKNGIRCIYHYFTNL